VDGAEAEDVPVDVSVGRGLRTVVGRSGAVMKLALFPPVPDGAVDEVADEDEDEAVSEAEVEDGASDWMPGA